MLINARDLLITNTTLITLKYLLGMTRWWVIKSIPRTAARNISEVLAIVCQFVLDVGNLPVLVLLWTSELKIIRQQPGISDKELLEEALTPEYQQLVVAAVFMYIFEMWTLKVAFLALFFDLKRHISRSVLWFMWATVLGTVVTLVANFIFQFAYCRPMSIIWEGKCNANVRSVAGAILISWSNILTDLALFVVGVSIVYNLRLQTSVGRSLWVIPAIGIVSITATTFRFVFAYQVNSAPALTMEGIHKMFLCSAVEVTAAYLAFWLPAARVLWRNQKSRKPWEDWNSKQKSLLTKSGSNREPFVVNVRHSFDVASGEAPSSSETELRDVTSIVTVGKHVV